MSNLAHAIRGFRERMSDSDVTPWLTIDSFPSNGLLTKSKGSESWTGSSFEQAAALTDWERAFNECYAGWYSRSPRATVHAPCGNIVVFAESAPAWLKSVAETLEHLLWLPANWDSYGARRMDIFCARTALNLLSEIMVMYPNTPIPSIVPSPEGGLQLEWHVRGVDMEIEIESPSTILAYYEILSEEEEWEDTLSGNLDPLDKPLQMLNAG